MCRFIAFRNGSPWLEIIVIMLKEFNREIYPRKLWVATSWEDVKDKFVCHKNDEKPIEKYEDGNAYTYQCVMHKKSKKYGTLILFVFEGEVLGSEIVERIAHESIHAANSIFDELNIAYDLVNDEHAAYLVGYVAKCCWKVLQNEIYKENDEC